LPPPKPFRAVLFLTPHLPGLPGAVLGTGRGKQQQEEEKQAIIAPVCLSGGVLARSGRREAEVVPIAGMCA